MDGLKIFWDNLKCFLTNSPPLPKGNKVLTVISKLVIIHDNHAECLKLIEAMDGYYRGELGSNYHTFNVAQQLSEESLDAHLASILENSKSVIICRTKEIELMPKVYEAIERWAHKNGDVPLVFINYLSDEDFRTLSALNQIHSIPERFKRIESKHIASMPFKLLQRATDRSYEWKRLAQFNRRAAIIAFVIISVASVIHHFYMSKSEAEILAALDVSGSLVNTSFKKMKEDSSLTYTAALPLLNDLAKNAKICIALSNNIELKSEDFEVEFWYPTANGDTIFTIGRSNKRHVSFYEVELQTIITGSYSNPNFVFWWSESDFDLPVFLLDNPEEPIGFRYEDGDRTIINICENGNLDQVTSNVRCALSKDEKFTNILGYWRGNCKIGVVLRSRHSSNRIMHSYGTLNVIKKLSDIFLNIGDLNDIAPSLIERKTLTIKYHTVDFPNM